MRRSAGRLVGSGIRGWVRERASGRAPARPAGAVASDARALEALERLGRLRESGVLDPDEFQAEKQRILAASSSAWRDSAFERLSWAG